MLNPLVVLDLLISAALICATAYYSYRVGKSTGYIRPWLFLGAATIFGALFLITFVVLASVLLTDGALVLASIFGGVSLLVACALAFVGMYTLSKDFEKIIADARGKAHD